MCVVCAAEFHGRYVGLVYDLLPKVYNLNTQQQNGEKGALGALAHHT